MVSTEVIIKSLETEKNLIKEAEKRLMQENQSLLEQQRSQNILLTNLQTIQVYSCRVIKQQRKSTNNSICVSNPKNCTFVFIRHIFSIFKYF